MAEPLHDLDGFADDPRHADEPRESSASRDRVSDEAYDDTGVETDEDEPFDAAPRTQDPSKGSRPSRSGRVRRSRTALARSSRPPQRDPTLPNEGDVLAGKFRVDRVLQHGAGVTVLDAFHLELGRPVSLKYLPLPACGRPDAVARLLREARVAGQIQSEHAARILDVGRFDTGEPFVVIEALDGWDLDEVLRVRGPLPVQEAVEYVIQAADAVAEAHGLGLVHGRLNLRNLVLTRRLDGTPQIKVLSFGTSPSLQTNQLDEEAISLESNDFTAVVPYLSPEQIRSADDVDARADVWALGAVLHALLAGAPPFRAKTFVALLAVVAADTPVPLRAVREDVAADLEAAVVTCLAKDRAARFPGVAELAVALKPYASGDALRSVQRISRLAGRTTRPPPLPTPRGAAIVPVARVASSKPPPPAAGPRSTGWMIAAAVTGAAIGVLGGVVVDLRARLQEKTARESAPIAAAAPTQAPPAAPAQAPALPPVATSPHATPSASLAASAPLAPMSPATAAAVPARAPVASAPRPVAAARPASREHAADAVDDPPRRATPETTTATAAASPVSSRSKDLFDDTR